MNNLNLAQVLIKKKPEFEVRLLKISNHAELDMYLNLAHKLDKKKPGLRSPDFYLFTDWRIELNMRILSQKRSIKKARELRSGLSIQFRG